MPPRIDFKSQRLFVAHDLQEGADNALSEAHAHYLLTVLRMETGTKLLAFNGKDGEWRVEVTRENKRAGSLKVLVQTRPQTPLNDLWFLFAPIKKERMDWMVQKAVEMGAGALQPVITEHTQSPKLRTDKLEANIIEAAEQCGVLAVPCLKPLQNLAELVATWDQNRVVFWCDEQAEVAARPEYWNLVAINRKPFWSVRRAASRQPSANCFSPRPSPNRSRSGRASCVPTRRRWLH